jgi:HK97 family phage prohead protease
VRLFRKRPKRPAAVTVGSQAEFSWIPGAPWLSGGTYVGTTGIGWRISREQAISVPAVKRGRDLICSTGALPLVLLDSRRRRLESQLLEQIDPNTSNVVTLAQTLDDLIFEGVAWWEITGFGLDLFPASARHLDVHTVSMTPPAGMPVQTLPSGLYPAGTVWVMGREVDARNIIRFDSPNDPLTGPAGARAIRRALKLAQTSEMYADDPEARAYWTPRGDADPGDEETIKGYLSAYVRARRERAEAYIPAPLERNTAGGPSAVDIQLAELQRRSDLEVANLLGIDPEDIGVNTTSRTYNNATDRRVDRLNMVLSPYMRAVTDRLSLNDVTPNGQRTVFDLHDYLKADPATRFGTYAIALDKDIMDTDEIREREELPVRRTARPRRDAPATRTQATRTGELVELTRATRAGDVVTVALSTQLQTSRERRTVSGTVLPYGVETSDWRRLTFAPGSVTWNADAVGRVKLDREHNLSVLLGSATALTSNDDAVTGTFKIARTAAGDEALALAEDGALDGLSAVVEIVTLQIDDSGDETRKTVTSARLRRVTMTADPAFADARIDTVAATRGGTMPEQPTPTTSETLTAAIDRFAAAVEQLHNTVPAEQRATVPVRATVTREPLVYSLDGLGHSFVRDAWNAKRGGIGGQGDAEALARLRKYSEQTADLAARATQRMIELANAGNIVDQADIIPPGYRPDLYVGQVPQGRPMFDSIGTRIKLANATPFKVPYWVGSAGLSGDNTENTGPSTGTITDHDYVTVTPTAQSGEFLISRELMDSANPAIDVIAMNAMREEYAQDTEAIIAAALAAATDDGSPVQGTSDTSTDGCYVYTVTGTGNDLYLEGIRFMESEFPSHRFTVPDRMLTSPTGHGALVRAIDDVGRPMFPFLSPSNAGGTVGRAAATLNIDGLAVPQAWAMTSTYDDVALFSSVDMLVGESPLLEFKFFEKAGPESIVLNIWGYFCFQILRPAGIHTCNYTAA